MAQLSLFSDFKYALTQWWLKYSSAKGQVITHYHICVPRNHVMVVPTAYFQNRDFLQICETTLAYTFYLGITNQKAWSSEVLGLRTFLPALSVPSERENFFFMRVIQISEEPF